ncbi:MAG TPA: G8 domain-containing protein [Verrucomicrobiae bacterium]|nr:G8 domain-containing protein [Verrucomicrobiae bacterium]
MRQFQVLGFVAVIAGLATAQAASPPVRFEVTSARSGKWSEPATWVDKRAPQSGENVQIRSGHTVTYDLNSDAAVRVLHVAGNLTFARDKSTRLNVGLLKVSPGTECDEDGFNCQDMAGVAAGERMPSAALEIGTRENPIPRGVTATIRLVYFEGMDTNSFPALMNCGGRMDIHGAPMNRTWVKLGATVKRGDSKVTLAETVWGWKTGDRIIVTVSRESEDGGSSYRQSARKPRHVETEERFITAIDGATVTLDKPLAYEHSGTGFTRSEVANLSRNVVIESSDPNGVRGHTMYHRDSSGGISYAEFRHLGKEGLLGRYSIHFHLVRDTMRGSGVLGASIWDSYNRWITIHGTDYLLVRDCVGYQSVGHGFFLEDATEQYNLLDRNLAVQAYRGKRLPKQILPFDPNDGAGFWWANGRNTFTRNVACENDEYGYRFEIAKPGNFDPTLRIRTPSGEGAAIDVRTIPFLRFEDNESHSEGLYSFNFGDDRNGSVHGDRQHPFVARNLRAWQTHYALRPNVQFFLMDGLEVKDGVYGVYHPDYDAHVYRRVHFNNVISEPINRGHDDESVQYGVFTYEDLRLENCRVGRDPLIQLACTSPNTGVAGHFRQLTITNSISRNGKVVDLGGGPRNDKPQNAVAYYFHDYPSEGRVTKVLSARFADEASDAAYRSVEGFTGKDVRAADVKQAEFPTLLDPVDDLPPATMVTSVQKAKGKWMVKGVSQDNGEIASVMVNGREARIVSSQAGVADWEITLTTPHDRMLSASASDKAGNKETTGHSSKW